MRQFIAFTKKEFLEYFRTHKFIIIMAVFLLFGFLSPLIAMLMPIILESIVPEGMDITIPEPSAIDSWAQFYKNITQMGLFIMVIILSGIMSNEYNKDTLINVLTKGLDRKTVILSKYTMSSLLWTCAYLISFIVTWIYTEVFWGSVGITNIIPAALFLWIYGLFLLSIIILGSTIFKNVYGALLFVGGIVILQLILNIIPGIQQLNPIMLASDNLNLIAGTLNIEDFTLSLLTTVLLTIVSLVLTVNIFNKKMI